MNENDNKSIQILDKIVLKLNNFVSDLQNFEKELDSTTVENSHLLYLIKEMIKKSKEDFKNFGLVESLIKKHPSKQSSVKGKNMDKNKVASELLKLAKLLLSEEEKTPAQKEYQNYFKNKLNEHDVDSPADLDSDEDKKDFFNDVSEEWNEKE